MPLTFEAVLHAAIFLLFLGAGLLWSLVLALVGGLPVWLTLAPAFCGLAAGHVVAWRTVYQAH